MPDAPDTLRAALLRRAHPAAAGAFMLGEEPVVVPVTGVGWEVRAAGELLFSVTPFGTDPPPRVWTLGVQVALGLAAATPLFDNPLQAVDSAVRALGGSTDSAGVVRIRRALAACR